MSAQSRGLSRPSQHRVSYGSAVLSNATPALQVVKESVSGVPVPGLEGAVGGALKIMQMIQVCPTGFYS